MIFDGHSDILCALRRWREQGETNIFQRRYQRLFQQGMVTGGIFVLWGNPDEPATLDVQVNQQLQTLKTELAVDNSALHMLTHPQQLELLSTNNAVSFLLGVEGLDAYPQKESSIDWLYDQGVRHVGLTWNYANGFASGVLAEGGLTALGRSAVKRIQQKNMLLDVAHLNDSSLYAVLMLADGPVLASHCNSRKLCNHRRNLTDDQLKAIAATGGVIGVNSYPPFISTEAHQWDLQHLLDHVVHMAYLVGTEAIGFGLDLNYWDVSDDAVVLPELAAPNQAGRLVSLLKERGFSGAEVQQICCDNLLRLVRQALA